MSHSYRPLFRSRELRSLTLIELLSQEIPEASSARNLSRKPLLSWPRQHRDEAPLLPIRDEKLKNYVDKCLASLWSKSSHSKWAPIIMYFAGIEWFGRVLQSTLQKLSTES
ncbi:MAG: hypothetical protein GY820_46955 [Gammaproteobacteria bacterium]|nr:hypothetical protein [Gammaproteobacteria bacterium]